LFCITFSSLIPFRSAGGYFGILQGCVCSNKIINLLNELLKYPPFIRARIQHDMVGKMLKRVTIEVFYKQLKSRHLRLRLSGLLSGHLKTLFSEKSSQKLSAASIANEGSAFTSSSLPQ